ncbi:MAG: oligosaccharide flippase family protein, partial [Victivallis vadensis]
MRKFTARSRKNRFQMLNAAKEFLKRAFHHDGVRRYGANTLWLMAEKVIRLAVGFSVGVYVVRFLGPAQYGLLNYAISFVALFSIFCSLGLDVILVRELVRFPKLTD